MTQDSEANDFQRGVLSSHMGLFLMDAGVALLGPLAIAVHHGLQDAGPTGLNNKVIHCQ